MEVQTAFFEMATSLSQHPNWQAFRLGSWQHCLNLIQRTSRVWRWLAGRALPFLFAQD